MNVMQLKRGDRNDVAGYTGPLGEITANMGDMVLAIQDGVTVGGFQLGTNVALNIIPEIRTPQNGDIGVSRTPTIISASYRGLGLHQASRWQISGTTNFAGIVQDSGWSTNALLSWQPSQLAQLSTLYVRIAHRGAHRGIVTESGWSLPQRFVTAQ